MPLNNKQRIRNDMCCLQFCPDVLLQYVPWCECEENSCFNYPENVLPFEKIHCSL